MLYFFVFLLFALGSIPGTLFASSGEFCYIVIPWVIAGALLLGTAFFTHLYKQKKIQKTSTYKELEEYITTLLASNADLASAVKTVRLVIVPDSSCCFDFNGQATVFNRIKITHSWFVAAAVSPEVMEYVKCTICHELSHLYSIHTNKTPRFTLLNFYILFGVKKKIVRLSIDHWKEEFFADYMGCKLYGNKDMFIKKMHVLNNLFPAKNKPSTHPSWTIRISFLVNGLEPNDENVSKVCRDFYRNMGYETKH